MEEQRKKEMSERSTSSSRHSTPERVSVEPEKGFSFKRLVITLSVCYLVAGTVQTLSLKYTEGITAKGPFSGGEVVEMIHRGGDEAGANTGSAAWKASGDMRGVSFPSFDVQFFFEFSFTHPFAQAFFMFIAESLCLVILLAQRVFQGKVPTARPHHPLVYAIPAAADFFASVIQNVGLFLTYASVYQMLRGATVVWIAVLSRFVFRRHYTKIQKWGIGTVILGLTLVGMRSIIGRRSSSTSEVNSVGGGEEQYPHQMIGNLLIISAQFLHAVQGVAEERLLQLYDMPPLQVIGIEGLYGLSFSIMLLAVLQWYPSTLWGNHVSSLVIEEYGSPVSASSFLSPFSSSSTVSSATFPVSLLKVTQWNSSSSELDGFMSILHEASGTNSNAINHWGESTVYGNAASTGGNAGSSSEVHYFPLVPYDDIHLVFSQMRNNSTCLITVLVYILSGLVYNLSQISIIKLLSAAATVLLGSLRNISVWLMCLVLPFFHERINPLQLVGFCFLILGNVLFQRVWFSDFESCLPRSVIKACPILFKEG